MAAVLFATEGKGRAIAPFLFCVQSNPRVHPLRNSERQSEFKKIQMRKALAGGDGAIVIAGETNYSWIERESGGATLMDREDFLRYFEQVRERTMRVVSAIPENKVEWTCRPGEWTFGDLARHIAATER